jgi:nucleotide-binding universal stress UspA family protein
MKILLPADGSEASVRAAKFLADRITARDDQVLVLTVLPYAQNPRASGDDADERAKRERAVATHLDAISTGVMQAFSGSSARVDARQRFGHPPEEIALEIAEWDPDLVVMGRRGLRGPARWLGSVSEHVLHHAAVPVLLVP